MKFIHFYCQALEQFKIINYSLNNILIPSFIFSIFVLFIFFILINFFIDIKNCMYLAQSFVQIIFENLYTFVLNVIKQNIGVLGLIYFPIVFNNFFIIYFTNVGGLIGYNFQLTSHIFVTFGISMSLFIGVVSLGLYNLELKFLNQFIPKDAPKILFPLLVIIETISYFIRPFTLGIRLFANIFSGHVLLFVIISFIIVIIEKKLIIIKILLLIFPIMLLFFIMTLEILIMFLQAYVFIILLCVYLNDSIHAH